MISYKHCASAGDAKNVQNYKLVSPWRMFSEDYQEQENRQPEYAPDLKGDISLEITLNKE